MWGRVTSAMCFSKEGVGLVFGTVHHGWYLVAHFPLYFHSWFTKWNYQIPRWGGVEHVSKSALIDSWTVRLCVISYYQSIERNTKYALLPARRCELWVIITWNVESEWRHKYSLVWCIISNHIYWRQLNNGVTTGRLSSNMLQGRSYLLPTSHVTFITQI